MDHPFADQHPFGGLDRVHHVTALRAGVQILCVLRHADLCKRFDHFTEAGRIDRNHGKDTARFDIGDQVDDTGQIFQFIVDKRQFSGLVEVVQAGGNRLSPFLHADMRPRM